MWTMRVSWISGCASVPDVLMQLGSGTACFNH